MDTRLRVSIVSYQTRKQDIHRIRQAVFVDELHIPADLEFDGQDEDAQFVLATTDSQAIGTGRLLPGGQIGRIAVLAPWRKQGIGTGILNKLIELAEKQKLARIFLAAQINSVAFYKKLGFSPCGETFMAAGILHQRMEKNLKQRIIK